MNFCHESQAQKERISSRGVAAAAAVAVAVRVQPRSVGLGKTLTVIVAVAQHPVAAVGCGGWPRRVP